MVEVLYTVDVEIWCEGWTDLDVKFPTAFQRYVYGRTPRGDYALPHQLKMLRDHGLRGVFFVEPLFATRFGEQPLAEVVGLIQEFGHEVQLHLHTEWVDESREPLLNETGPRRKRQFMHQFDVDEQTRLIRLGIELLRRAGAHPINAFRAGSFGLNADTLTAVARNGLQFDASYNAVQFGPGSGVAPGGLLLDAAMMDGVCELPMTVFRDGLNRLRPAQLGACSFGEIEASLWASVHAGRKSYVMLSHNFELLNPSQTREDPIVVRRFDKLCSLLSRHRDIFSCTGCAELQLRPKAAPGAMLTVPRWRTAGRVAEQAWRRGYR